MFKYKENECGPLAHIYLFFFPDKMSYQHRHSRRLGRRGEKRLDSVFHEIHLKKKCTVCDCKLILLHSHSVISYFFCTKKKKIAEHQYLHAQFANLC